MRFHALLASLDLPKIRLYDLRHTHASLLIAEGKQPKLIAERLGHSSIKLTMDTYGQLFPGADQSSVRAMNQLFSDAHQTPRPLLEIVRPPTDSPSRCRGRRKSSLLTKLLTRRPVRALYGREPSQVMETKWSHRRSRTGDLLITKFPINLYAIDSVLGQVARVPAATGADGVGPHRLPHMAPTAGAHRRDPQPKPRRGGLRAAVRATPRGAARTVVRRRPSAAATHGGHGAAHFDFTDFDRGFLPRVLHAIGRLASVAVVLPAEPPGRSTDPQQEPPAALQMVDESG
jgi:hypothetical protein